MSIRRHGLLLSVLLAACPASHDSSADANAAPVNPDAGGSAKAYVSFDIPPSADCSVPNNGNKFLAMGNYDVSKKGPGAGDACKQPYVVNLLVTSGVKDSLHADSAEIELMTLTKDVIVFDREAPKLPNPFKVSVDGALAAGQAASSSTGIVSLEAIPVQYAAQLGVFAKTQILAKISIFATTGDKQDVEVLPFIFPIQLCAGCLTRCASESTSDAPAAGEVCDDNAGADGRVCVDPGC